MIIYIGCSTCQLIKVYRSLFICFHWLNKMISSIFSRFNMLYSRSWLNRLIFLFHFLRLMLLFFLRGFMFLFWRMLDLLWGFMMTIMMSRSFMMDRWLMSWCLMMSRSLMMNWSLVMLSGLGCFMMTLLVFSSFFTLICFDTLFWLRFMWGITVHFFMFSRNLFIF